MRCPLVQEFEGNGMVKSKLYSFFVKIYEKLNVLGLNQFRQTISNTFNQLQLMVLYSFIK